MKCDYCGRYNKTGEECKGCGALLEFTSTNIIKTTKYNNINVVVGGGGGSMSKNMGGGGGGGAGEIVWIK